MTKHKVNEQNGAGDNAPEPVADDNIMAEATAAGPGDAPEIVAAEFDDASGALPAQATPEQVIAQMQAELDSERARNAELYDKFQRSAAEFQNTRRRQEKQTAEAIERASTLVIRKLIPVLDDLDLAFDRVPASLGEDQVAWVEGFRQIQRKLQGILEEEGVKQIPSDAAFDPKHHEAVSSEPNESVPSGHIIATLRVGYEQRGHVLRPALVRVSA